jgi:hypothetical protein
MAPAALILTLLVIPRGPAHGQPPPPKADPPKISENAWTFDEARDRLALSPRDTYLQYVVLQLGRREGRENEALNAIVRQPLLGGLLGTGRRERADLFATFTGALAIQESLQLDTMRGDAQTGPRVDRPDVIPPIPQPPKPKLPEKVAVATLTGPTVPSHPWEKMLGGKKPDVGPLAAAVPEDFYFAEFRSAARLHEVLGAGQLWAGHIFTQALGGARSQLTAERIKKQLGLIGLTPEQIDKLGVEAIGVTGSDPFLSEGSDVTLLVQGKKIAALAALADAAAGGTATRGEHIGIAYTHRSSPDGALNAFSASPRPDLHIRGNSLPAFKRVLEAVAGKTAEGKPARRLGESAEFKYVRTRMMRDAGEDGFVYLSDSFIRRVTGPQLKLTERRRVLVYNHLRMIGHAALLFRTEHGRAPKSLEELAESKCAPGVFGKGNLAHPDGGTYTLAPDGMSAVCSKFGRAESMTPCIEHLVTEVSGQEAEDYKLFVADYSQYWRTFFDPIAIKVTVAPKQYRLETLVLPLIDNSIYTELARNVGRPVPMDLLPTPKREIGGLWVHLPKQPLLDALGPDRPAKEPGAGVGPVGKVRRSAEQMRAANDLKIVGLGIHSYHDLNGHFPDDIRDKDGKPLLSWRVALLPFIEGDALYKEFKLDEPWDSEHNKKLIGKMPKVYAGRGGFDTKTPVLRPAGKGTMFPPDKKLKIADVTDGLSNTILAVESADAVEWTKPADLTVDPKQPLKGLVRKDGEPFQALMADGSVRAVPANVDPTELLQAFNPADGKPGNLDPVAEGAGPDPRPKAPFEVQNDLRQFGLAVLTYNDANNQLPFTNVRNKEGKALLSWRVAILPYLEQGQLYKQFKLDEPWDSEHNKKLIAKMPRIYCGSDEKLNAAGKTPYLVPAGRNTLSPPDGAKFTLASIRDGTSNTVMIAVSAPDASVIWTKPDDLPFDPKDPLKGLIRPGQDGIDVVMADGSARRFSAKIDPKKFAALVTPSGGEVIDLEPGEDLTPPPGRGGPVRGTFDLLGDFKLTPEQIRELEKAGVDLNKLRRFLRDGIGDQIGFHMHDAPRLLDSDLSGLFGGEGQGAALSGLGLVLRFAFGSSSVSIPVKDVKIVDDYLDELDKLLLAQRQDVAGAGLLWRREVDFYRVPLVKGHTIRCLVVNFAGLKWRLYWGRIGDGLYIATRPFILEDIAAAHAEGKRPAKTEPAHAVLRVRPENWNAVLPGYNLGWAESNRAACHANLDMVSNVSRGWNDRKPVAGPPSAKLLDQLGRVYGERPFCPDGGTYELSADGRVCRCSVHGGHDDPHQPAAPTAASSTGRLLKSFGGLTATVRFEEDGLRVIVTMDRKE